ncbi:hypothetical protein [Pseudomonas aeruginosa]|uniref:hypothetical protein n=1 Tax=Pseudomonas aeruginosa TaxID=287 RepID=UPI000EB5EF7B|nr:hypothetical protein [Pseudomonas aeruginosa]
MSIASQALVAAPHSALAVLSEVMFAKGDEVKAKNRNLPFWMTVVSVNPRTGFCQCNFGASGNYAGNFHQSELRFNRGTEYAQAAG